MLEVSCSSLYVAQPSEVPNWHACRRRRQQGTTAASDDLSALSLDLATAQSNVLEGLNSRTHSLHVPMSQALPPSFSYQVDLTCSVYPLPPVNPCRFTHLKI